MSFNLVQFRDLIVRTLRETELPRKESAINLLLGTAAQESAFGTYLRQTKGGPALGVFQMEPETFAAVQDWSRKRYPLVIEGRYARELEWDLSLAILSARLNYIRFQGSIPEDVIGQAEYWKRHWNTYLGKGTVEQYLRNWKKYCV